MKPSRSRVAVALRVLVTAVLATSAILVPTGTASAADTETPVLISFSVSDTTVTPGQQVTFSYVATEGAGSLSRVRVGYLDGSSHLNTFTFDGPLAEAGSVTMTIPDTWWNGLNALNFVELTDPSGNTILYHSDGSTYITTPGASGPSSHTVPFTPGDLTLSGSTADSAVPSLTSVSVSGSPAHPGDTISVHYEATDAAESLKAVKLTFRNPRTTAIFSTPGTGPVALNGVIDLIVPATWPNGEYVLEQVTLTDPHDNRVSYNASGSIGVSPSGATGPTSNTIDFGAVAFSVSGSTADFTPPALTSITRSGSPVRPGEIVNLNYVVESQDPLTQVEFKYVDRLGKPTSFKPAQRTLTGTVPVSFPLGSPIGDYTLQTVSLRDSAGNSITYQRDGATFALPGGIQGRHTIVLSAADIFVGTPASAPPMYGARARSGSAIAFWGPATSDRTAITGYTVTAQPGGRTVITNGSATQAEVTGLTNGTSYRLTVTATNALGVGPASAASNLVTPRMTANIMGAGNFSGEGGNDLIGLRSSTGGTYLMQPSYLYRGNGLGGFSGSTSLNHEFSNLDRIVFSPGDFNGNGTPDVMTVSDDTGYGSLDLEPGNGHGGFTGAQTIISNGWGVMRRVFGPGDFSGDHKSDVLAVNTAGYLYLYRGNGVGGIAGTGVKIGTGWGGFQAVFSPGDFTGDGKSDVMAVSMDGGLYLYRGNGAGGFAGAGQRVGTGWGGFLSVFSPGDFSGDHRTDVMAVNPAGDLLLFQGNGRGGWASGAHKIGQGWAIFR